MLPRRIRAPSSLCCRVIQLEDNDVLHMVKGDYAIFNMAQPDREQAVERVHQVLNWRH